MMGVWDYILLAALALWAAAAVIWMVRRRRRGSLCCGCSGCDACRPDASDSRRESPDGAGKDGGRAACSGSCASCRGCDACRKQKK